MTKIENITKLCFYSVNNVIHLRYLQYWLIKCFHWPFSPIFVPLEFSQAHVPCSLLSGFYRVVKHFCRLSQTQLVAVFRGQVKRQKIREILKYISIWQKANINQECSLILIYCTRSEFFFGGHIVLQHPFTKLPGQSSILSKNLLSKKFSAFL